MQDLGDVINLVHERIGQIDLSVPFLPDAGLWKEIVSCYSGKTTDNVQVVGSSLVITTGANGLFYTISSQEIPRVWAVLPYAEALLEYECVTKALKKLLGRAGSADGILKKLPSADWHTELDIAEVSRINDYISNDLGLSADDKALYLKFLTDTDWSGVSKTLDRGDWRLSAVVVVGGWLANAASRRGELADALIGSKLFEERMVSAIASSVANSVALEEAGSLSVPAGTNRILYGAPGTGKSHKVDMEVRGHSVIRTVFHPDTQNSDFFGCLKPTMEDGKVVYGFVPGPLSLSIVRASVNPSSPHYLVIEELNRAPAAAVFGELFQLLDRDETGRGSYEVDFPAAESANWYRLQGYGLEKLVLPANLNILATMNSSDQGVYPLDTAFRRRWEQEYLPLYSETSPEGHIEITKGQKTPWQIFVRCLNDLLLEKLGLPEDRLLGAWFLKTSELNKPVPNKILLYLWDDVLRHEGRSVIFAENIKSFSQLIETFKSGKSIFSTALLGACTGAQVNSEGRPNHRGGSLVDSSDE